jgi:hypothetical protein
MTQILARCTNMLDSRKKVPMSGRVYLRAIVPIGLFFSLSLICGNQAYLYLSVAFIQMLKVRMFPHAPLLRRRCFAHNVSGGINSRIFNRPLPQSPS